MARVTQLVYHPAFDPYNALLRVIRLLIAIPEGTDAVALRILDFYLLFPDQLLKARLTAALRSSVKKLGATSRFPYDRLPSPRGVFDRMETSFEAALQTMTSRGMINIEEISRKVQLRIDEVPDQLLNIAREQNTSEASLMTILASIAAEFRTDGPNGLKDRSSLAEYRYDAI